MSDRTDLLHECPKVEGIAVHHDAPDITHNCVEAAQHHAHHKEPGAPSQPKEDVQDARECEENDKQNISCKTWTVPVDTVFERACV